MTQLVDEIPKSKTQPIAAACATLQAAVRSAAPLRGRPSKPAADQRGLPKAATTPAATAAPNRHPKRALAQWSISEKSGQIRTRKPLDPAGIRIDDPSNSGPSGAATTFARAGTRPRQHQRPNPPSVSIFLFVHIVVVVNENSDPPASKSIQRRLASAR